MKLLGLPKKALKNWQKKLLSHLQKKLESRYYDSIETMPVLNWWKIHEENDFKWLLSNEKKKVNRYAQNVFKRVKSEFINEFGIDRKFEQYLDKVWKLELLNIDMALTGDRSKKIFADILELEINDLLNEEEIKVHNHGVIHIEKYMGFKLDVKKTTVYEFYSYVKEIEKQIKHLQNGES
jgi:hypothetical protein